MANEKPLCLTPACGNLAWSRGLCTSCLTIVRRVMRRGERLEADLIAEGKILPVKAKQNAGRKTSARTKWFMEEKPQ